MSRHCTPWILAVLLTGTNTIVATGETNLVVPEPSAPTTLLLIGVTAVLRTNRRRRHQR